MFLLVSSKAENSVSAYIPLKNDSAINQYSIFTFVKLYAKILLCIAAALLFTHQLIPHHHDRQMEFTEHSHLHEHNVEHVFYNDSHQPVTPKITLQYIECDTDFFIEIIFVAQLINLKRRYEKIRSPLIAYSANFSLRAPPVS